MGWLKVIKSSRTAIQWPLGQLLSQFPWLRISVQWQFNFIRDVLNHFLRIWKMTHIIFYRLNPEHIHASQLLTKKQTPEPWTKPTTDSLLCEGVVSFQCSSITHSPLLKPIMRKQHVHFSLWCDLWTSPAELQVKSSPLFSFLEQMCSAHGPYSKTVVCLFVVVFFLACFILFHSLLIWRDE